MALPQLTTHHSEVERGHPAAGRARSEPSAATPLLAPTPRRILVVHLAGFGDLVMGLPALHALRRGFPESRIELLTWARNRDVVELLDCLDAAHFLDGHRGLRSLQVLWRLRAERFDLAVNFYQLYRWTGVGKLAGLLAVVHPRRTAGRNTDGKGWWFDVALPERSNDDLHEVQRQLRLAEALGGISNPDAPTIRLRRADQDRARQWLAGAGIRATDLVIAMHPGAAQADHRWPWQSFNALARLLEERVGARIILTGAPSELPLVQRIAAGLRQPLVAAGVLSIGQLACVLQQCRLFITNDTGPMHLAAALQVPLLAVMGPSDPRRYGPYPLDRPGQMVLHAAACPPCYRKRCRGHEAFERLPVSVVLEAAEDLLRSRGGWGYRVVPERLRVLHVHTLPIVSGSGLNTWLSMRGQQRAGYDVELACAPSCRYVDGGVLPTENLRALIEAAGLRFRPIRHLTRSVRPWHDLMAAIELWRLCRRHRYAIVHTHNSKAGIIGRVAAKLAGVPIIVHTHHSCVFRYAHLPAWQRECFRWLEGLVAPWTDFVITISEALRREFVDAKLISPERVAVIYSGIEVEAFRQPANIPEERRAMGWPAEAIIIGCVARLDVGKGHEELLAAFAAVAPQHPRARLVCVGDGPLRRQVEAQIQTRHLSDRVVLLGERQDIPRLTRLFDLAVLASHYEGMGRVLLEAQAAGKPVIATRAGGMTDIVDEGRTGFVVPVGDRAALAEALGRLLADEALRHTMGQAATAWVSERFSSQHMCEQLEAVYARLLQEKLRMPQPVLKAQRPCSTP